MLHIYDNIFKYIQLYSDYIKNYTLKHIFSTSWGEEFVLKAEHMHIWLWSVCRVTWHTLNFFW